MSARIADAFATLRPFVDRIGRRRPSPHHRQVRIRPGALRTLIAFASLAGWVGAAPAATRTYSATGFDRVRLEGPFAVSLRTGPGSSVRAEADDPRALDTVRIDVVGRTLVVRRDRTGAAGGTDRTATTGIRIVATTPDLVAATVLGSGTLAIDRIAGDRFDLIVSGAGAADIGRVDATKLTVTVAGAGRAGLAGKALSLRASVQGAGMIAAADLSVADATILSAGAGTIALAATRTAKVDATGSGAVTIAGRPACTVASAGTVTVTCAGIVR